MYPSEEREDTRKPNTDFSVCVFSVMLQLCVVYSVRGCS